MPTPARHPALHPHVQAFLVVAAAEGYGGDGDCEILYALALSGGDALVVWEGSPEQGVRGNAEAYLVPPTADLSALVDRARADGVRAALFMDQSPLVAHRVAWSGTVGVG